MQIARGAQERKKKTSRIDGKEKEKKKQIYREKLEKLIKIIEKKRLQCKTVFKFT